MNRYSKALKQLKSTKIDSKIKKLEEAPTNNTKGVYSLNPQGYRLGKPSPPTQFFPKGDGTYPDGVPGTEGEPVYTRPGGFWDGGKNWESTMSYDAGQDGIGDDGKNTDGLIASDGTVKTMLPDGARSFVLGPLTDGFVLNHTSDAYTNIGYVQKDTREFVLLAKIDGQWKSGFYSDSGSVPVWDGTATGFTAHNENFTLAMAQWMRTQILADRYYSNLPYFYSGGVPQGGIPDCPTCLPGMKGGSLVGGGGSGGSLSDDGSGTGQTGTGSGDDVTTGDQHTQDDPNHGDQDDAGGPWPDDDKGNGDKQKKLDDILDKIRKGEPLTAEEEQFLRDNNMDDFLPQDTGDWISDLAALGITYAIVKALLAGGFGWLLRNVLKRKNTVDDVMDIYKKLKGKVDETDDMLDKLNDLMQAFEGEFGFTGWQAMDKLKSLGKHGLARKIQDAMNNFESGVNNAKIIRNLMKQAKKVLDGAKAVEPDVIKDFAEISKKLSKIFKGIKDAAGRREFKVDAGDLQDMFSQYQAAVKNGRSTSSYLRQIKSLVKKMSNPSNYKGLSNSYEPEGKVILESRSRILREIKKPFEVPELPKKYKMNFKGKFTPQNTPDKTASKESDGLAAVANMRGQKWSQDDKYWAGYETTETMNVVYDKVGHGEQAWNRMIEGARQKNGWKNREIIEQLNIIAHEKASRKVNPDYQSPWVIQEASPEQIEKEKNFDKVNKLKQIIGNTKRGDIKPEYPDKPAVELGPDGYHPDYGKKYKHDKLDPDSAEAMPDTGNPEIDANIKKRSDVKRKARKLKTLLGKMR